MSERRIIYLDNNSTTKVPTEVVNAMLPFFDEIYANSSSRHRFGFLAEQAISKARKQVATLVGASYPEEIVFTSGATEAINQVIKAVLPENTKRRHIVTCQTEHKAILDVCAYAEKVLGYRVTYLPVKDNGLIDLDVLADVLSEDVALVAVMYVNNETGVIQPIQKIAEMSHRVGAICFSDYTQALGKVPVNLSQDGVDIACFNAHKFHGPKGVGGIWCTSKVQDGMRLRISPLLHGGGHEKGKRSGTLNVPAIVGMGVAAEIAFLEMESNIKKMEYLRNFFEDKIKKSIDGVKINSETAPRVCNTSNITINAIDSEALIAALCPEDEGAPWVVISNGSACSSHTIEPSYVLRAMGLSEDDAAGSIRVSLSKFTTEEEIDIAVDRISFAVKELRELAAL
ncbi:cysteine desulfurase [Thermonema lapsum]|uniref:Cysteine desulfurase n=1 Tax=Thermonema lapsum TaxID=28195 RepID=A0A846MP50_9BACT|nr:cysteine desulfurase family protein [Thermonema lapsum]NIK73294.1 cysteine desulfurase [Thermonema lapsum]